QIDIGFRRRAPGACTFDGAGLDYTLIYFQKPLGRYGENRVVSGSQEGAVGRRVGFRELLEGEPWMAAVFARECLGQVGLITIASFYVALDGFDTRLEFFRRLRRSKRAFHVPVHLAVCRSRQPLFNLILNRSRACRVNPEPVATAISVKTCGPEIEAGLQ